MIPRKTLQIFRSAPGHYDKGLWVKGIATEGTITASVQPISGESLRVSFSNESATAGYTLYTNGEIKTSDEATGTEADQVTIWGAAHKIIAVEQWQNGLISHKKATAVKMETRK